MSDFFTANVIYTSRENPHQPPEVVINFWPRLVDEIPGTGLRIAFGYFRRETETEWKPTGLGDHDWVKGWEVKERTPADDVPRETSSE